jgi:hypothetical protein
MKWFKHSSLAAQDAKLKKLRIRYGMQGYGLYWYCLELIASEVDSNKLTFELEHDSEILAHDTGINSKVVEEMMFYMVELGLFENIDGVITCFALAKRADEYLVKSLKREGKLKELENVRSMSGHSLDKVRPEESKGEEIKENKSNKNNTSVSQANPDPIDETIQTIFDYWKSVMGKDGKSKLTQKRKSKIKARLKDGFEPREICEAINGCAKSPHHMGQNDTGAIYDDLELICRDDSKVKMFLSINQKYEQPYSAATAKTIETLNNMEFD